MYQLHGLQLEIESFPLEGLIKQDSKCSVLLLLVFSCWLISSGDSS